MTGPNPSQRLDQVFFGWSPRHGGQSALAGSFEDTGERERWLYHLRAHLRLQRMPETDLPDHALSYFTFADGTAALLRRVPIGISTGRNNSHALIGPAGLLTPRAALGIQDWTGWLDEAPESPLAPVPDTLTGQAILRADTKLRPLAAVNGARLVPILAAMLAEPHLPVSVIGCPESLKTALIWALVEIAEHTGAPWPDPGFSTYETQHDEGVEDPPHLLFLPRWPFERGEVRRTVVDLAQPVPDGPHVDRARQLHQRMADGWPVPVAAPEPVREPVREPAREPVREPARPSAPAPAAGPAPLEEQLVAALREAGTPGDLERILRDLRRLPFEGRQAVRAALGARALDDVALRIEVDFRDERLRSLLEAVYGPGLADLDDPLARRHAIEVVREGGSEQVALLLSEPQAAVGPLRDESYQRWAATARRARPEPGARLRRRISDRRRARYLPLAALAAGVAILLVAFLGGVLLGVVAAPRAEAPVSPAPSAEPGR